MLSSTVQKVGGGHISTPRSTLDETWLRRVRRLLSMAFHYDITLRVAFAGRAVICAERTVPEQEAAGYFRGREREKKNTLGRTADSWNRTAHFYLLGSRRKKSQLSTCQGGAPSSAELCPMSASVSICTAYQSVA